jgi:Ca-activated chloride channel family protein
LAEAQIPQADPVAGLIDIPLPQPVSLLPQTWPSRVAIALLLAAAIAAVWRILHQRHVNRYRREALAELGRIEQSFDADKAPAELVTRLAVLVRRTALAAFPRETIAPLAGSAWLSFLDSTYDVSEFSESPGRLLASAPYQRIAPDGAEVRSLAAVVRRWIRGHHA